MMGLLEILFIVFLVLRLTGQISRCANDKEDVVMRGVS